WLTMVKWSPYITGAGIGLLACLTLLLSDRTLGCSTAFARFAGMVELRLRGKKTLDKPYFRKVVPEMNWDLMVIVGIVIGSFLSSIISGSFEFRWVPPLFAQTFGNSPFLRLAVTLVGGVILGFGSRWAGGCTSGHGISGTMQLTVSSWIAAICFFIGGIATAFLMYNVIGNLGG
ncbi:MAG: YeeE/YedE thiosulfate transporter family protein, partial [Anaerolineae bacterium]|nr:YeeE/YedE thiosulfate transporter family protein [Anaerolineae bacterium]